ncbi:MAG: DUF4412 domain-containing protein [Vicinamibacterales bacterium]
MRKPALWLALAPVVFATSVIALERGANPGVVFEMEVKDLTRANAPVETSTIAVEGPNIKVSLATADGAQEIIFHGDTDEMVMVNHQSKTYTVMDPATLEQLAGQMGAAMAKMQEALKNVPESQRAMMEKMMKERMGAMGGGAPAEPVTMRNTGERGTQAGYAAVKWEAMRGSRRLRELWVAGWSSIDGAAEARPAFQKMAEFGKKLMDTMAQSGLPMGNAMDEGMFDMNALNGFPVLTRELDEQGKATRETRLKSARQQAMAATDFQPPKDYRRQTLGPGRE